MKSIIGILRASLLILLFHGQVMAAPSIAVTGAWYETIDKNDLALGPGSDLKSTHASASGQIILDISGTAGPDDAWRVEIRKVDDAWDGRLRLWVRKTAGGGYGGESFQEITNVNTPFFSGTGDVNGIRLQLQMTGASIAVPPSACSTMVYYTVVDVP